MQPIVEEVKTTIPQKAYDCKLSHAAAAVHMTMIRSVRLGACMTLSDERVFNFNQIHPVSHLGEIEDLSLSEILKWTESSQGIERSFGFAALNGAIELKDRYFLGNALDIGVKFGTNKNITMIGHFSHVDKFRQNAKNFWILEKRPHAGDLPAEEYVNVLPESDVVVATGVTFLNDTLEGLLKFKKPGSVFIVVGPSVPLSSVLFDYGVDIIGGAYVEDEPLTYRKILQGASPRLIKDSMRTVLFPKDSKLLEGCEEIKPIVKNKLQ